MRKYHFVLKAEPNQKEGCWRGEVYLNDKYIMLLEDFKTERDMWLEFFEIETDFIVKELDNFKLFEAFYSR